MHANIRYGAIVYGAVSECYTGMMYLGNKLIDDSCFDYSLHLAREKA